MTRARRPRPRRLVWVLPLLAAATAAAGGAWWYLAVRKQPHARAPRPAAEQAVHVEVTTPRPGGIDRVCVQPGTVEPFESADVYAKVSGFLAEQTVDIGSRVKRGQVLAHISVPEFEQAVARDQARVGNAKAKVKQMEAHLTAARSAAKAAHAQVGLAESEVKSKASYRAFREKQLVRIRELSAEQAIDARRADEVEDQFEAAQAAEFAARAQVTAAKEQADAAEARVLQSDADLEEAKSGVGVAEAELARSKVFLDYATVTSPYDGVITRRNFFRGDFVRSADVGGTPTPLFAVDRTDMMRVVVQVPDRDVQYVSKEDPAVLEIDALPGQVFSATVARWADAEDPGTRTMRTELDLPNRDGLLRRGMYGRATLTLATGSPKAVRVPSAALVNRADRGKAAVRVVRDGRVRVVPVRFGTDNGIDAEVTTGLAATDQVIVRASAPVEDGTAVTIDAVRPGR